MLMLQQIFREINFLSYGLRGTRCELNHCTLFFNDSACNPEGKGVVLLNFFNR